MSVMLDVYFVFASLLMVIFKFLEEFAFVLFRVYTESAILEKTNMVIC